MIRVICEFRTQDSIQYKVANPLLASSHSLDLVGVSQGHYRVGAKADLSAFDNELPTQIVQLSNFQIDRNPISNGQFLDFIEAAGYQQKNLWSDEGWQWLQTNFAHPHHWRRDTKDNWYGVGINGPFELQNEAILSGISHHEAQAYARWIAQQGGGVARGCPTT